MHTSIAHDFDAGVEVGDVLTNHRVVEFAVVTSQFDELVEFGTETKRLHSGANPTLETEQKDDDAKKETCESDRAEDTRDAIVASREIDAMTDALTALATDIEDVKKKIAENEKQKKETETELASAVRIRSDEKAAYEIAKKEDTDAVALIGQAIDVLEGFYKEKGTPDR